jgi:predicted metal-dependent peptidase
MPTMTEEDRNRELDRVKAEIFVSNNAAFLGPLMASLNFVWTTDVATCATDYTSIFWNPADFDKLERKTRVSSLLHELAHNYRLHGLRQGQRDQKVWNIACDIPINRDLRKEGYEAPPPDFIQDMPEIKAELEEEIYEILMKNAIKVPAPSSGGKGNGQTTPGQGNLPQGHCSCHQLPPPTKAQMQAAVANVVQAVNQAKIVGQPGSIPGNVESFLDTFLKAKIPWSQHVGQWLTEMLDTRLSYARPNRRYQSHGILIKSRYPDEGRLEHLVWAFDVSGSVTDDQVTRFNSELRFVKDTYRPKKMTLVLFDTKVRKVIEINEEDEFNRLDIVGRGGTDLEDLRKFIMKSKATAAVIFTDLDCAPMKAGPKIPIIWVCIDNPGKTVPYGKLIHITVDEL